jgi:predicted metal-dependent hydrolase
LSGLRKSIPPARYGRGKGLPLPKRLTELAAQHGFRYGRAGIRNQKSRWGSCSSKNNISLNIHLLNLPGHLRDYVILHELVHTEQKNHSKHFWFRLDEVAGGRARELRKEMKSCRIEG